MGFNAIEIGGLVVIAVVLIIQTSAVSTLKWQTYESKVNGRTVSADYGLFRACINNGLYDACASTSNDKEHKAAYDGAKATAILSILSMFGFFGAIFTLKIFLKKSTLIPTIALGILSVLFSIVTVVIYAEEIKIDNTLLNFGASFYSSCVAIGLACIGFTIHFIGSKNSE